jgi:hypothetical protein
MSQGDALFLKNRIIEEIDADLDVYDEHLSHRRKAHSSRGSRSLLEMIGDNFIWFRARDGYDRLPEIDSEIDEEISFAT